MNGILFISKPPQGTNSHFADLNQTTGLLAPLVALTSRGARLLSPAIGLPIVPGWGSGQSLQVTRPELLGCFKSPDGRCGNWLFFSKPPEGDVVLQMEGVGAANFRRATIGDFRREQGDRHAVEIADSVVWRQGGILSHLYRETKDLLLDAVPHQVVVGTQGKTPPSVWLNPVILILPIDGEDLRAGVSPNGVASRLAKEIAGDACLKLEPLFSHDVDPRALVLVHRSKCVRHQKHYSLIDWLLFGPPHGSIPNSDYRPWLPFLTLDYLGGKFLIDRHGTGTPTLRWSRPHKSPGNAEWLATVMLGRCGGTLAPAGDDNGQYFMPPGPCAPFGRVAGSCSISIDNEQRELAVNMADQMLRLWRRVASRGLRDILRNIECVLRARRLSNRRHPVDGCHWGSYDLSRLEHGDKKFEFRLDELDFVSAFGSTCCLPRSPVRIEIPTFGRKVPEEWRYLDLAESVHEAARHFTCEQLKDRIESELDLSQTVLLPLRTGWWNEWHKMLFRNRCDVHIEPHGEDGFVLNNANSLLGRDRLGTARISDVGELKHF